MLSQWQTAIVNYKKNTAPKKVRRHELPPDIKTLPGFMESEYGALGIELLQTAKQKVILAVGKPRKSRLLAIRLEFAGEGLFLVEFDDSGLSQYRVSLGRRPFKGRVVAISARHAAGFLRQYHHNERKILEEVCRALDQIAIKVL